MRRVFAKKEVTPVATTNAVDRAKIAIQAYIDGNEAMEHEPLHEVLSDLLADLMHWADAVELDEDRQWVNFDYLLGRARGNYAAERSKDPPEPDELDESAWGRDHDAESPRVAYPFGNTLE